jgi:hypothetical protein
MALLNPARRAAGAAVMALLAGGCDLHPPTYVPGDPDQLVVHAVLRAGSDSATVIVGRVGRGDAPAPASGAQVRIIGPGGTGAMVERESCSFPFIPGYEGETEMSCYAGPVPGGVHAGTEYRLEVDVPGGERVRGRTTVPATPLVYAPEERLRQPYTGDAYQMRVAQPVAVRWRANGAASLVVRTGQVWAPDAPNAQCGSSVRWERLRTADTAVDSASATLSVHCGVDPSKGNLLPDSLEVMLSLAVYDSAYTAYYRDIDDEEDGDGDGGIPLEQASKGLEGAYGLFGSAAERERRVIVYRQ